MIQEKDFLYRVPVKTAPITTPRGQIRNPEILVDLEGGEFMHGNILDANSTNKLINQSVKDAVDDKFIESGYVTKDLLEAETSARTKGDEDLSAKIQAEQTRAEGKEKEISDKLAIVDGDSNTEGSFRKAIADVIAAAPEDLDTLKEIADKLAGNDDLHTALNQAITEKADATALSNYVLTTALNQQIDTLNTAIDAKQPKGNYLTEHQDLSGYAKMTNGVTEILNTTFDEEFSEANINKDSIVINNGKSALAVGDMIAMLGNKGHNLILKGDSMYFGSPINSPDEYMVQITSNRSHGEINLAYAGSYDDVAINADGLIFYERSTGGELCRFSSNGITSYEHNNCLATSDGTFKPISDFALKTELPTVPTKVSELQNDSEFIVKSVYDEKIAALEARIAALEAKHPEAAA